MKLERKHKLWIIIGIGAIFIIYGLLGSVFEFHADQKVVDQVSFVLMLIAFALLFSGRKKKNQNTEAENPNNINDNPDNNTDNNVPPNELGEAGNDTGAVDEDSTTGIQDNENDNSGVNDSSGDNTDPQTKE